MDSRLKVMAKVIVLAAIAVVSLVALPSSAQAATPATPTAQAAPTVVTPSASGGANARISPCGGAANAKVYWGLRYIQFLGNVYDNCGAGTYVQVFVSCYSPTYHNMLVGTAGPGTFPAVNWKKATTLSPGRIVVTACEHYNGWHCGAGVRL